MKIEMGIGIVILILAIVFIVSNTGETDADAKEVDESSLNISEKATEEDPHTAIVNPELTAGVSEVIGTSFFNRKFDCCVDPGVHLALDCPDDINVDSRSKPVSIEKDSEGVVTGNFTVTGNPGTYRCSFDVVCDNLTMASSSTSLILKSGGES